MRYFVLLLGLLAVPGVQAKEIESWRCGNGFVELGMHRNEIMDVCSTSWMPDEIRTKVKYYTTPRQIRHFVESLPPAANTYQFWIYRNYGQYETWLWLRDGYLIKIEKGDRG